MSNTAISRGNSVPKLRGSEPQSSVKRSPPTNSLRSSDGGASPDVPPYKSSGKPKYAGGRGHAGCGIGATLMGGQATPVEQPQTERAGKGRSMVPAVRVQPVAFPSPGAYSGATTFDEKNFSHPS
jgi:hypothetical protein